MKLLLVDDHQMVRLGLKSYFELQEDVEVVGEATNGAEGISMALALRPDVIVMDIVMPEVNGIDATLAILKELEEKSELKVSFKYEVDELPKKIEEHVFRIVQELISNTLRHAQASCLDVYLYQTETGLQLKVVDNGLGFQLDDVDELSYGLRNIKERVEDMAGNIKLLTAPKQGLAVDIRIPLLD